MNNELDFWSMILGAITALVIAGVVADACGSRAVTEFGGEGEACYPNDSCDPELFCYRIADDTRCEKSINRVEMKTKEHR